MQVYGKCIVIVILLFGIILNSKIYHTGKQVTDLLNDCELAFNEKCYLKVEPVRERK